MILAERLTAWAVPRSALRIPTPDPAIDLLAWFRTLGFGDPQPKAMALRWTDEGCVEIPVGEAIEDEDLVLSADDMASYCPTLEDVAAGCVSTVHDHERSFPGPFNWRRWRLTNRFTSFLYASGIARSGGSASLSGADPYDGWVYTLPKLSHVKRGDTLRPYVLFKRDWWWKCHARQGWTLRGRHKPEEPFVAGTCAACLPCPSCGAHRDCGCVL